jgi:hypothetical protein
MGKFTLEINTDNDAFSGDDLYIEILKKLTDVGFRVSTLQELNGIIVDSNGNTVGAHQFKEEIEDRT